MKEEKIMYIIVGLGNIGKEYENTRHNIGFKVLDAIAKQLNVSGGKDGFRSTYIETRYGTQKLVLAKPTTYMNNSGFAVQDLMSWYKCAHNELIVIYDDIELPPGDIRIREKGSSGTHNGMRSIIYQLGYDDFPRIRVGIGKQKHDGDLVSHVLGKIGDEDEEMISQAIEQAAQAALMIADGKLCEAQTKFNKKKSGKPKKQEPQTNGGENAADATE